MADPEAIRFAGVELTVRGAPERGRLTLAVQQDAIALSIPLDRDQVRELVGALDDWLYDSRPA